MDRPLPEPDYEALFDKLPGLHLVLDGNLLVVAANDAYLEATFTDRADIVGRSLTDIFPGDPEDDETAAGHTRASVERALQSRKADSIVVRRKGAPGDGGFELRYWHLTSSPVLHSDGSVAHLIHRAEDVTEFVLLGRDRTASLPDGQGAAVGSPGDEISLPVDDLLQHPAQSGEVPVPADVEAAHILIVENDPDMNAFLAHALGRHYWISRYSGLPEQAVLAG